MSKVGLEPTRDESHTVLSRMRLPVSPLRLLLLGALYYEKESVKYAPIVVLKLYQTFKVIARSLLLLAPAA